MTCDQPGKPVHQPADAAHRKKYPPAPLEKGDQAVDRTGGKRVAADQQRMKAQGYAKSRILHKARDEPVDAAIAAKADGKMRTMSVHEPNGTWPSRSNPTWKTASLASKKRL